MHSQSRPHERERSTGTSRAERGAWAISEAPHHDLEQLGLTSSVAGLFLVKLDAKSRITDEIYAGR